MSMSLLLEWGAYARDKNTSARPCAKKVGGGAYPWGGHICRTLQYYLCPPLTYFHFTYYSTLVYNPVMLKGESRVGWKFPNLWYIAWVRMYEAPCAKPPVPLYSLQGRTIFAMSCCFRVTADDNDVVTCQVPHTLTFCTIHPHNIQVWLRARLRGAENLNHSTIYMRERETAYTSTCSWCRSLQCKSAMSQFQGTV